MDSHLFCNAECSGSPLRFLWSTLIESRFGQLFITSRWWQSELYSRCLLMWVEIGSQFCVWFRWSKVDVFWKYFILLDVFFFGPFTREEQAFLGFFLVCVHLVFTSYCLLQHQVYNIWRKEKTHRIHHWMQGPLLVCLLLSGVFQCS